MTTYNWRYEVSGSGSFPIDMLRYDSAWPRAQADAIAIERRTERRTVALQGTSQPTMERWASFGWNVLTDFDKVRV